jgi:hypothetical protein
MSVKEPYIALAVCAAWGLYGGVYFAMSSKAKGKAIFHASKPPVATT